MSESVAVVILAGGEGRRIGGGKPRLELAGKRLIDRAIELARRSSELVAVAVRDEAQVQPVDVTLIPDDQNVEGPLGGLIAGLKFMREREPEKLLTIPADMPFLPDDLLDRLGREIGERACALASSGGHLHPVCGLWRASALDRAPEYLAGESRSLKGFAALTGFVAVDWTADPEDPFFNINSPDDLAEAERRLVR